MPHDKALASWIVVSWRPIATVALPHISREPHRPFASPTLQPNRPLVGGKARGNPAVIGICGIEPPAGIEVGLGHPPGAG